MGGNEYCNDCKVEQWDKEDTDEWIAYEFCQKRCKLYIPSIRDVITVAKNIKFQVEDPTQLNRAGYFNGIQRIIFMLEALK